MEVRSNEFGLAEIATTSRESPLERRIEGVAVSRGVALGTVVFFDRGLAETTDRFGNPPDIDTEVTRFRNAVASSLTEIRRLLDTSATEASQFGEILRIQLLILSQSSFVSNVEEEILTKSISAESALENIRQLSVRKQEQAADPHLREKRVDIEDVCNRLALALAGEQKAPEGAYRDAVVVAYELTPTEIVEIAGHRPSAVITERGGWTSHTSILAREFRLPMVSGVKAVESILVDGETVLVDGNKGVIVLDPSDTAFANNSNRSAVGVSADDGFASVPSRLTTSDGIGIEIRVNADTPAAYAAAKRSGAVGVGLFRSESLIKRHGSLPSEDEQYRAYREIAKAAGPDRVRIRTFDIGIDGLSSQGRHFEANPSLGLRSIRLSLREKIHFRSQIRAILRAGEEFPVDIVLPMISGVSEVDAALSIIQEERSGLLNRGIECGKMLVGAMIEVPSAIFTAREIASKVDFLALGTNDLVQYLLAVDRDNDAISDLYQTLNPAVIRSLQMIIVAAADSNVPLIICGEMAGSAFYVPLLIGLGSRELSMNANSVTQIRSLISEISVSDCQRLVASIEGSETADDVESILREFYRDNWKSLFPSDLLETKHR